MTDQEFQQKADEALAALDRALERAADQHGFEVDSQAGALTMEFEDTAGALRRQPQFARQADLGLGAEQKLQTGFRPRTEHLRAARDWPDINPIDPFRS